MRRAEAAAAEAKSEAGELRRLLRLKGREIATLRHLGQEVLLQRSEVEIFLIAALQQAKAEASRAGAEAGVEAGAGRDQGAAVSGVGAAEGQAGAGQQPPASGSSALGGDACGVESTGGRDRGGTNSGSRGGGGSDGAREGLATSSGGSQQPAPDDAARHAAPAGAAAAAAAAGVSPGASGWAIQRGTLDLRDLTWEQRERVLRLLFARVTAHAAELEGGGGGSRSGCGGCNRTAVGAAP